MTYKDILYVVSTYESQSISAAAKSLYISQSALSQAIRKLEDELGMPLFIRTGTHLEPTKGCDFFVARDGKFCVCGPDSMPICSSMPKAVSLP